MTLTNNLGHRTILSASSAALGLVEVIRLTELKDDDAGKKLTRITKSLEELEKNYFGLESARVYFKTEIDISQLKVAAEQISEGNLNVKKELLNLSREYHSKLPRPRDMPSYLL